MRARLFASRLGTVFDELVAYPEYRSHEMLALYEMLQRTKRRVRVIGWPGPDLLPVPGARNREHGGKRNEQAGQHEAEAAQLSALMATHTKRSMACSHLFPLRAKSERFDRAQPLKRRAFTAAKLMSECAASIAPLVNGVSNGCWPETRPYEAYTSPMDAIVQIE